MENIDERLVALWALQDGELGESEQKSLLEFLESHPEIAQEAEYIRVLAESLEAALDLDLPSMRFNRNVMEAIETQTIAPATRTYVNNKVMALIAAISALSVLSIWAYASIMARWEPLVSTGKYHFKFPAAKELVSGIYRHDMVVAAVMINGILLLVLLDRFLRRFHAPAQVH
jgi:hypothetical protein